MSETKVNIEDFRPINDGILVKVLKEMEAKTSKGIILPSKSSLSRGLVIRLGKGKKTKCGDREPFEVKIDETVCFQGFSGAIVGKDDDGCEYKIIYERDILVII